MPKNRNPDFDMLAHDQELYRNTTGEYSFKARSWGSAVKWQKSFRKALREALGLTRMEKDLAGYRPRAQRLETKDCGFFIREKWRLWTEPGVPIPFWLLRPLGPATRRPLVLTPHGHEPTEHYIGQAKTRKELKVIRDEQRDVAIQSVMEGYTTILPTVRSFGETRGLDDTKWKNLSSCRASLMHGLLVGRTPIGERVWDIERLIDWAVKRNDVDAGKIAITGNSGGGTVSLFAAACDTRISASVPASYFCTFYGSIGSIWHCDCNYIPGLLRLGEMSDVAGLIAPRPFCAIQGKKDDIYPFPESFKSYMRLRGIYRVFGAEDKVRLFVGDGGHRYYSAGCWPFLKTVFGAGNS
jgi:hypothetical protein